jgi:hypothetical protein
MSYGLNLFAKDEFFYSSDTQIGEFWLPIDYFVADADQTYSRTYSYAGQSNQNMRVLFFGQGRYQISSGPNSVLLVPNNWFASVSYVLVFAT